MVIHMHLADDRDQDECRYLLKFQWQLSMSYREVTWVELREHVSLRKLAAVEGLIAALAESPDAVEQWIQLTVATFPVIQDRGYRQWRRRRQRLRWAWWLRWLVQPYGRRQP